MKLRLILATSAMLALAACENSGEKAERFYQSGLTLMEEGDLDRAIVELRNVFTYQGDHYEARKLLVDIYKEKGDMRQAYAQLLRLAEQYPDDAAVRRELTQISIEQGQWDEAERHGKIALELEPDAAEARDIKLALDYRRAIVDQDSDARAAAAEAATERLTEEPDDIFSLRILVAEAIEGGEPEDALKYLDALITADSENMDNRMLKLRLLAAREDRTAADAYLTELAQEFPENREIQLTSVGWAVQNGNIEKAEGLLRGLAGADTGPTDDHMTVIKFLEMQRGEDVARDEAARLAAANEANPASRQLYQSLQAFYDFNLGQRDQAVTLLEQALTDAEPSDQTNRLRAMLAGMKLKLGDRATAQTLIQEVLTADANNVFALRLRAQMELDDDKANDAVNTLRQALNQNPRDTETLMLLATAYDRSGNRQLTGETLASAVDISGSGVSESLRYADFLMNGNRSAARSVITDALGQNPVNIDLLMRQGQMALEDQTYAQVQQVIETLDGIEDDPRAAAAAETLRGAMMIRQGRTDEGLAVLEQNAATGGDAAAVLSVVRAQVVSGRIEEARSYLDGLLAKSPNNDDLRMIDAGLALTEGDADRSEKILRDIIEKDPSRVQAQELLYRQLTLAGRGDDATALLDAAMQSNPGARNLQLLKAAELELAGDIDGAVKIYDTMYQADTGDIVIANNLASMLATWRDDPESLARAAAVAQRLNDTRVPAFQDTYGWIVFRNGDATEALKYLEPAAQGLPNDPLVQYHLGMVQAELGRNELARASLSRALELADGRNLPQFAEAQAKLDSLGGPPVEGAAQDPVTAPVPDAPAPKSGSATEAAPAPPNDADVAPTDGADAVPSDGTEAAPTDDEATTTPNALPGSAASSTTPQPDGTASVTN